jgi:hypothetical protein
MHSIPCRINVDLSSCANTNLDQDRSRPGNRRSWKPSVSYIPVGSAYPLTWLSRLKCLARPTSRFDTFSTLIPFVATHDRTSAPTAISGGSTCNSAHGFLVPIRVYSTCALPRYSVAPLPPVIQTLDTTSAKTRPSTSSMALRELGKRMVVAEYRYRGFRRRSQ